MFENFNFPEKGSADAFWQAQKILGEKKARLNDYFSLLIYNVKFSDDLSIKNNNLPHLVDGGFLLTLFIYFVKIVTRNQNRQKFDILLNPSFGTFSRQPEQILFCQIVEALLDKKLKICIIDENKMILKAVKARLKDHDKFATIIFLDPKIKIPSPHKRLTNYLSKIIAKLDYNYIVTLLNYHQINTSLEVSDFQGKIDSMLAWLWAAQTIDFETAILRVEWDKYSFPIKYTRNLKGNKVIALQHGVISHTLDIPVTVDRFIAFGEQSVNFLKILNNEFYNFTHQPGLCTEFLACGSLIDNIKIQENNFDNHSVLIIDQSVKRAIIFNGLETQIAQMEKLIEDLLRLKNVNKIIVRPHPEALSGEFWDICQKNYPEHFELSNQQLSLDMDIARSSIAVGLFSGALVIAASSGLPTYLLRTENGYQTPDLNCFDSFALPANEILGEIKQLIIDQDFYLQKRKLILEASSQYYYQNQKAEINQEFLTKYFNIKSL